MSDMRITHTDMPADNRTSRIVAGAVVALGIIGLGVYGYEAGAFRPASPVAYNDLPAPGMPLVHK